ncbi:ribonuclease Z [Flavobacterium jejuense]|uniref:Ribonuclease Z n=1 Tax=Flavobacterium jejuense TaxID=1544455 RepID=A0ABX0IY83_9FLAO|nr:ribonuclease Z [Flavobacterium jejuense]NHN26724.1 ribonuclease Z [Flavobacterium jejuense]
MKVDKKGHTTVLKETKGDLVAFIENISNQYASYKDQNLILDLSHDKKVTVKDVINFKNLAKQHTKSKKSFVIVVDELEFDEVPEYLTVVPSLLEAHDIIEMEEIERDLGF